MVDKFAQDTGLKFQYALDCLQETHFVRGDAERYYTQLRDAGKLDDPGLFVNGHRKI